MSDARISFSRFTVLNEESPDGASKREEKQKWAIEKPKLLRDPDPLKHTKMRVGKLEFPMPTAKPCKFQRDEYA